MDDVARSVFIKKSLNVLRVTSYDNRNHNLKRKMMKLTFSLAALFGVLNTLFADVVLYSSHRCPYCRNVDNYLQSVHKKVSTKIIDDNEVLREELKNKGGKIFIVKNSKVQHLGKQASENILNIELCRNWHWMWSLFYYNYKHFGIITAYRIAIIKFFSSIFKLFFSFIFFNKKKILIHYYRLNGLFNAFLQRPSWFRPDNI
jgi:glutaredoxin